MNHTARAEKQWPGRFFTAIQNREEYKCRN